MTNQISWVLAEFKESLFEDIQELRSIESNSILLARRSILASLIESISYGWQLAKKALCLMVHHIIVDSCKLAERKLVS